MNLEKLLLVVCLGLTFWLYWVSDDYDKLNDKHTKLKSDFNEQVAINEDYEKRIESLHELDIKHTTELTNAKAEIDKLRDDVRSGAKRVYVKAKCPSPENSSTSGVDVGRSPTLEGDAEQDYFNLLKQLKTLEKQFLGLRDYYYTECKK
ncbi:MAG: lysis protein [Providencia sp.]|uniref:lysis protein n=1 Tax=Providencia sp. TaxID=589 RepID=UPI003F94690D